MNKSKFTNELQLVPERHVRLPFSQYHSSPAFIRIVMKKHPGA